MLGSIFFHCDTNKLVNGFTKNLAYGRKKRMSGNFVVILAFLFMISL